MFGPGKGYDPFFGELGGSFGSAIVGLNAHVGVRARVFPSKGGCIRCEVFIWVFDLYTLNPNGLELAGIIVDARFRESIQTGRDRVTNIDAKILVGL
jgi:hypothetical protein